MLDFAPQSAQRWGLSIDNYTGPLHFIDEDTVISIDDDQLSVLLTPGHSPGSLSFYCEKQGFIISGDVLFKESIGRTDLPGGDFDTLITSIQTKLFTLPPTTLVYNGHGSTTTIGHEIKNNPYLRGSCAIEGVVRIENSWIWIIKVVTFIIWVVTRCEKVATFFI